MVSVFKTSCFIFGVIWISTFAFLFGIQYIQRRYSSNAIDSSTDFLMSFACVTTVIMAILGCCCIKFDVTHICCAAWYIGLTSFGIVIICVLVMNSLKTSDPDAPADELVMLRRVIKDFSRTKTIPYFLYHTQTTYKCCGIVGFKDYRAFILPANIRQDVHYSCCTYVVFDKRDRPSCKRNSAGETGLEELFLNHTTVKDAFPIKLPRDDEEARRVLIDLYGKNYMGAQLEQFKKPSPLLPVNPNHTTNIALLGCYKHLKLTAENLHDTYFKFCLIIMAAAILMTVLYIRNCVKARRLRRDRMKEMILGRQSAGEDIHKGSVGSGEISEEEQQQILHDLTYVKTNRTSADYANQSRGSGVLTFPPTSGAVRR